MKVLLNGQDFDVDIRDCLISEIAAIIRENWNPSISRFAQPYVDAMSSLSNLTQHYGVESGQDIVNYFLCNASTWRGDVAKAVKYELRRRIKELRKK